MLQSKIIARYFQVALSEVVQFFQLPEVPDFVIEVFPRLSAIATA
jgi:hypothetical protein